MVQVILVLEYSRFRTMSRHLGAMILGLLEFFLVANLLAGVGFGVRVIADRGHLVYGVLR